MDWRLLLPRSEIYLGSHWRKRWLYTWTGFCLNIFFYCYHKLNQLLNLNQWIGIGVWKNIKISYLCLSLSLLLYGMCGCVSLSVSIVFLSFCLFYLTVFLFPSNNTPGHWQIFKKLAKIWAPLPRILNHIHKNSYHYTKTCFKLFF